MKDSLKAATVRIVELQHEIDSIKNSKVLVELKYKATEQQEIINQVNDFYDKSWISLLWLIGVLVGIFGLVLPIISQLIASSNQRKGLRELTETISNQLTESFDQKIELLRQASELEIQRINTDFKEQSKILKKENKKEFERVEANLFVLQSRVLRENGDLINSGVLSILACSLRKSAGYNETALNILKDFYVTLKKYNKESFDKFNSILKKSRINKPLEEFLNHLKESEDGGAFVNITNDIENQIQTILNSKQT